MAAVVRVKIFSAERFDINVFVVAASALLWQLSVLEPLGQL